MIPKRIHYCWFSGDPYPDDVQKCMASWRQHMPEYECVLWDMNKLYQEFPDGFPVWLQESLQVKKWAFAADYIRLYAVNKYGGIYLDSDCFVYKTFDDLLNKRMFIGRENRPYVTFFYEVEVYLTSHCFGAEAGHPFMQKGLEYYQDRHFITCSGKNLPKNLCYDMLMMPYIQGHLASQFGYDKNLTADKLQNLQDGLVVYPTQYFGLLGKTKPKKETHAAHWGLGYGWREPKIYPKVTLSYKIHWRLVAVVRKLAKWVNCIIFEYK
ncbi:MAG: capsular polysaccharide synthesis protein [Bacteroidales bacterium]|nr:capsular polysaccharide synthesis protein [Bacteroidales bacterium]